MEWRVRWIVGIGRKDRRLILPIVNSVAQHRSMHSNGRVICGLLLSVLSTASGFAGAELAGLLRNCPFGGLATQRTTAVAGQPQIELRGVVHEGNAVYLTFFDPASKKWMTLSPGEQFDSLIVKEYRHANESVVLNIDGKMLVVNLKPTGNRSYVGTAIAANTLALNDATAATAGLAPAPMPSMVLQLPESEAKRLDLVSIALRQRAEAGRRQDSSSRPASGT